MNTKTANRARARRRWLLALTIVVLSGVIAGAPARAQQPPRSDFELRQAVERQLLLDLPGRADRITVEVDAGVVALRGQVDNLLARQRAERLAERPEGVREVRNRIVVSPDVLLDDADVERAVEHALTRNPAIESYRLAVAVEDGVARLTGTVHSLAEHDLAGTLARQVRGVVAVVNDVAVAPATSRTDEEILEDVRQRLRWDALVDAATIDVTVDQGRVALAGTVDRVTEKRRAHRAARVEGVTAVDASGLRVEPPAEPRREARRYALHADEDPAHAVRRVLEAEPRLRPYRVEAARAPDGTVVLSGTVGNASAAALAERLASEVRGVREVDNRITVHARFRPTDRQLERRVSVQLANHPLLGDQDIRVQAENGRVVLTGSVASVADRADALDLAGAVAGVTNVVERLRIE